MLIDSHAHLTDEKFNENRFDIISSLSKNNVEKVFCVAYNKKSLKEVFELSQKFENIYAIIGIHPEEVDDFDDEAIQLIKEYSKNSKVIGIGEIGLDYHFRKDNIQKQKQIFVEQIKLAYELQLPISIHNRESTGDLLKILEENKQFLTYGGVLHCFSESVEVYNIIKKFGLKIAFGGTLTFKNNVTATKVCEIANLDDILIETDCPYLTPVPFRGQTNEPKNVSLVAQKIGEIKKLSYDTIVSKTTQNALNLFTKASLNGN